MRSTLITGFITVAICFGLSQAALAVCVQNGNTPGGGNLINCPAPIQNTPLNLLSVPNTTMLADEVNVPPGGGIDVGVGVAIDTDRGNDVVTTSGNVTGASVAINTGEEDDTVTVNGGTILSVGLQPISSGNGNDMITVNAGTLISNGSQAMFTSNGNDKIVINGGILDVSGSGSEIMFTSNDNDMVILNGGTYIKGSDEVIDLGDGDDMLVFGGDIDLGGFVNCRDDGFDTLVFAMEVPEELVVLVSSRILAQSPQDGSVVINGITYEWIDCNLLVVELIGVPVVRPIPTLSQWGLIAMAVVLGIIGLLFIRRRQAIA